MYMVASSNTAARSVSEEKAELDDYIESVFDEYVIDMLATSDDDWVSMRMGAWVIFANKSAGIQAEIGYMDAYDEVFLMVYDYAERTYLDATHDVSDRPLMDERDVIEDCGMAVCGAIRSAMSNR